MKLFLSSFSLTSEISTIYVILTKRKTFSPFHTTYELVIYHPMLKTTSRAPRKFSCHPLGTKLINYPGKTPDYLECCRKISEIRSFPSALFTETRGERFILSSVRNKFKVPELERSARINEVTAHVSIHLNGETPRHIDYSPSRSGVNSFHKTYNIFNQGIIR